MVIALQEKETRSTYRRSAPVMIDTFSGEAVAICPKCKTFETLWFVRDALVQTQKFNQREGQVYHDCGSNEPCRLYRNYLKVLPTEVRGRAARRAIAGSGSRSSDKQGGDFDTVLSAVPGGRF